MSEKYQYGKRVSFLTNELVGELKTTLTDIRYERSECHGDILFMDDEIQLATGDEYRYHEMLVHPTMSRRTLNDFAEHHVLIIGGGDGCAAREVLKWYNVTSVTIVDHDGTFVNQFAKTVLSDLNQSVYSNPKCKYVEQDAVSFLKDGTNMYDVILIDLPDPDSPTMVSLYLNVIEACKPRLNPRCGSLGMHVGPAVLDRHHRNWHTIHACKYKLASVFGGKIDFGTVHVPSFSNEWAFLWMSVGNARYTPEQYVADRCGYWTTTEKGMSRDMNALYFL